MLAVDAASESENIQVAAPVVDFGSNLAA